MWQPISRAELEELLIEELQRCTQSQKDAFAGFRVQFYQVPIHRFGKLESVWLVAELPSGLLYYEDVEEGFEIGVLGNDGALHDQGCNQYELSHALAQAGL
jgi:hypothetical protein